MQVIDNKLDVDRERNCVMARNDLQPGEKIIEELPLYVTPHWECEQMKCSNCLMDSFVMCKKCKVFPLCIDCTEHDTYDCQFFQIIATTISKNILVQNYAIYATLKLLLLIEREGTNGTATDSPAHSMLADYVGDYNDTKLWHEHNATIVQPLLNCGIIDYLYHQLGPVNAEYLHRLCRTIDAHAFEVINSQGDLLKGVYAQSTQIPHNCIPNALITLDYNFQLCIHAAIPIAAGEIITISYVNPLLGSIQRREQLHQNRQVKCTCFRCTNSPNELGTNLSTLKCLQCDKGNCEVLLHDNHFEWKCSECNSILPSPEVERLLKSAEEELTMIDGDLKAYEIFLEKYSTHLHTNHFLLIEAKQQMIGVLRLLLHTAGNSSGRRYEWLQLRVQLCGELLPILRNLQPGISKLYGIALYEFVTSFVHFAELQYATGEINDTTYVERLQRAHNLTQQALEMLVCEPINSPEGHLRQRVIIEQNRIAQNLQKLST